MLERIKAVMQLQPGSFRAIADFPNTLQSVLVFLIGYALVGSFYTLALTPFMVYPVISLVSVVFTACYLRFVAARVLDNTHRLPSYPDWVRAWMFTAAPLIVGIVPFLGGVIGVIYSWVLQIFAIKDMSGCTTGRAVVILLVAALLPVIVLLILAALFYVAFSAFAESLLDSLRRAIY